MFGKHQHVSPRSERADMEASNPAGLRPASPRRVGGCALELTPTQARVSPLSPRSRRVSVPLGISAHGGGGLCHVDRLCVILV
ncbi:unnamed protein product, partial [Pleuronectes platessa]